MMFPIATDSPVAESVFVLDSIHPVQNRVVDLCLQFTHKAIENAHSGNRDESRSFDKQAMAGDRHEGAIDYGKGSDRFAFYD
jgi:hypothetical protein